MQGAETKQAGEPTSERVARILKRGARILVLVIIGGASWEIFAVQLVGGECYWPRVAIIGALYAIFWEALWMWLGRRSPAATFVVGAVFPYVTMLLGLYGIWTIFVAVLFYYWLFVPAGLMTALAELKLATRR
ncbi:MAG: hypothetical protein ACF8R7_02675 [Phycisphaerales bacterium JB039]